MKSKSLIIRFIYNNDNYNDYINYILFIGDIQNNKLIPDNLI
ncbi:hypothetical protein [Clostridium kluyveri]|nr:hypothetical protein [Clostridium kluyveri]